MHQKATLVHFILLLPCQEGAHRLYKPDGQEAAWDKNPPKASHNKLKTVSCSHQKRNRIFIPIPPTRIAGNPARFALHNPTRAYRAESQCAQ